MKGKELSLLGIVSGIVVIGLMALVVIGAAVFFLGRSRAVGVLTATPNPVTQAAIVLSPGSGYAGTQLTVRGTNWPPGEVVFIRLRNVSGEMNQGFAYAGGLVNERGEFETSFAYPYRSALAGRKAGGCPSPVWRI